MPNYYDTSNLPFAPAVRVKPISRHWDLFFNAWRVKVRVVPQKLYGYQKAGDLTYVRWGALYATCRTMRGGKLAYENRMSLSEFNGLPISEPLN